MPIFTDHLDRKVHLKNFPPQRIISLVPSQTELLYSMGMGNRVVGITKFCVHPTAWFKSKTKVGGTKSINFQKVAELQPDLIIGNKEENEREQLETLASQFPVWVSEVKDFWTSLSLVMDFASILGSDPRKAWALQEKISRTMGGWMAESPEKLTRAAYFIWRKPLMVAGGDTFINSMLEIAGFENVFQNRSRYPEINEQELQKAAPEVILLSSEPYPFEEKHFDFFLGICPTARVLVVDGEMFSWYGSRLLHAPDYFRKIWMTI